MKRKHRAVITASFGTAYKENLDAAIGAIEKTIAEAFPDCRVYRAFTGRNAINELKERYGLVVDDLNEALERAAGDGITELAVLPTHLLNGRDYMNLKKTLDNEKGNFVRAAVGKPLLSSASDFDAVIKALTNVMEIDNDGETAFCLMGHGTEIGGGNAYKKMQERMKEMGLEHYYIGSMESEPSLEDVLEALGERPYKRIVLRPLMVCAGLHAHREMAGSGESSWKSVLENRGYEVRCILEGLGEIPAIRDIYADHAGAALKEMQCV